MALSQADVLAGIKEIVEEVAGIPAASIELDKNFTEDLEVDSLSMVEVVVACEERFGVKIPDEKVTELATVGDAVNFIVNAGVLFDKGICLRNVGLWLVIVVIRDEILNRIIW